MTAPGLSCGMRDLILWPGIKPVSPELEAWRLSHWTREVLCINLSGIVCFFFRSQPWCVYLLRNLPEPQIWTLSLLYVPLTSAWYIPCSVSWKLRVFYFIIYPEPSTMSAPHKHARIFFLLNTWKKWNWLSEYFLTVILYRTNILFKIDIFTGI